MRILFSWLQWIKKWTLNLRHIERESEREVQSQSIDYNQMKHSSESRRRIRDLPTKKTKNRFNKKFFMLPKEVGDIFSNLGRIAFFNIQKLNNYFDTKHFQNLEKKLFSTFLSMSSSWKEKLWSTFRFCFCYMFYHNGLFLLFTGCAKISELTYFLLLAQERSSTWL